jgi:hypothetical protein
VITRRASRAGVVLAVAALALTATPALAAAVATDFGVELRSTTIAADANGKWPHATFENHGTAKPESVVAVFDGTELDPAKVTLTEPAYGCEAEAGIVTCTVEDDWSLPGPGEKMQVLVPLKKVDGATGAAGKLTVSVKVEGDTVTANNSRTAAVSIGGNGADLSVYASDVTWVDAGGRFTHEPVPPGEVAPFAAYIANQGDVTAHGIRVSITLPKLVTFQDQPYEHCATSRDRRTLKCDLTEYFLVPRTQDSGINSGQAFDFDVRVSKDAKGPVTLQGGTIVATAIEQYGVAQRVAANPELPEYARWMTDAELAELDADPADNKDDFAVVVRGPAPGDDNGDGDGDGGAGDGGAGDGAGGNGDGGSGDGGGQGGGGGLPVTGPGALGIAGGGLAAVAAGAMLLLVTRRRRAVQQ